MLKTIRFFKINEGPEAGWYADVPNHTLAENEMVAGSDTFLEEVDQMTDNDGEVHIICSDNNEAGSSLAKLLMKNHNQFGATYILTGPMQKRTMLWATNFGFAMSLTTFSVSTPRAFISMK